LAADLRDAEASVQDQAAASEPAPRVRRSPWLDAALAVIVLAVIVLALWRWQEPLRETWQERFGKAARPGHGRPAVLRRTRRRAAALLRRGVRRRAGEPDREDRGVTMLGRSSVRASVGKPPQQEAAALGAKLALTAP